MALELTYYGRRPLDYAGVQIDALPEEQGAMVPVADAAISTVAAEGLYLLYATTACVVRIGPGLANATGGRNWASGHSETRYLQAGSVVAVDAA